MTAKVTWKQALAWRMRRHYLDPVGDQSVAELTTAMSCPRGGERAVSKQSGWIAPVVLVGGVVHGTWELAGDRAVVAWFKEAGAVQRKALQAEVERPSTILGRGLRLEVEGA